ncbi:MAG: hypothetical protein KatS3mg082_2876 [Nitrospiraceae bacterium]|nr:MAG: hypothetical protein KatS3mg082_2876 [Nitrospiraceae bacterium]
MAEKVGAGVSTGLSAFYGHLVPSPLDSFAEGDFLPLTQYHSNQCILVNTAGRRFMDESLGDDYANQDVFRQPERRAVLIADERIRREYVVTAPFEQGEAVDRFERAADAGARFIGERTLDRLATRVAAWGVNGSALLRTLRDDRRLADPPFYALEVQPTITFPHGGLLIDGDGRVVDRDGRWIPGLYAAGADVGGVFNRGYAGGLAAALVFGRRAGRAAADWAADRQSGRILEMRRPLIQTAPRERYVS